MKQCYTNCKQEKNGLARVIVMILAIIGLMTAAALAADILYRKYKKYLASLNDDDSLEGLGEDCFEDADDEGDVEVECDFAESETAAPEVPAEETAE